MKPSIPLVLALLFLSGCQKGHEQTQVRVEDITESVYASGVVKSRQQYLLYPVVSGIIQQVMVSEGDMVLRGSTLMKIRDDVPRLNAENSWLAARYSSLEANREKLTEWQTVISMAKSKMQNDSLLLLRQQNLWKNNIGTQVALEQMELNYENSVTAWKSAVLKYEDLKKQLDYSAKQSRKNLQLSQLLAEDYTIKSETDGKVYSLLKEKGEMVNPQSPVAMIGDADEFIVELQVDEYDIVRIKAGQRVLLSMDSYRGQVFEASVFKLNPAMNEKTRSFKIEAAFVQKPPVLYPNLTAEANILIQQKKNVLTIPRAYLLDEAYVLLEDGAKVKVKTGIMDYQKVEILEGLAKGDILRKPE